MKSLTISRHANGYSITLYKESDATEHSDFTRESLVFHNAAEVIEYLQKTLVDVADKA